MRKKHYFQPFKFTVIRKLLDNTPIISILFIGLILRFYRIRDYLVFLGDEGRDVLVVKRMLIDHKFTLLGPITSTGGMYLGPIYYYFISPFLWLFAYDPVGPAIMVALFGVATIYLIYRTGLEFFDKKTAIFAALLFATSPLTIIYTRSSWNPNILPFFSLLIVYSLLKTIVLPRTIWLFIAGISFGISIQLHYLALMFIFLFALVFLFNKSKISFSGVILFIAGFLSTFWPFILFELRHGFLNTLTIWQFLTKSGSDATLGLASFLERSRDILTRMFWRLLVVDNITLSKLFILAIAVSFIIIFIKKQLKLQSLSILLWWLTAALFTYSIYRGAIYDYYFVPVFTLPFLLTGIFLNFLYKKGFLGRIISIFIVMVILFFHLNNSPFRIEPNRLLDQTENISRFVVQKTNREPYNFALISTGNSDHAYRYFFELWNYPPTIIENPDIDPQRKSVTKQLLIICEQKNCQVLGHSLWEIAGFGQAEIDGVWEVFPVKVIRLRPYKHEKE